MRKILTYILLIATLVALRIPAQGQVIELIRMVTTEVIKAIDLQVQKQQNQVLALQAGQKAMENKLSEDKLAEIESWLKKQNDLYREYYSSLKKVAATIGNAKSVSGFITLQTKVARLYQETYKSVQTASSLNSVTRDEIINLLNEQQSRSMRCAENLTLALTNGSLSLTDGGRLILLRGYTKEMEVILQDLTLINRSVAASIKLKNDSDKENSTLKKIYGL